MNEAGLAHLRDVRGDELRPVTRGCARSIPPWRITLVKTPYARQDVVQAMMRMQHEEGARGKKK